MNHEHKLLARVFKGVLGKDYFLPGFVRAGRRVCGKQNCGCKHGKLHPARVEYGYFRNGKSYLRTIPPQLVDAVVQAVERCKLLEQMLDSRARRSELKLLPEWFA